MKEKAFEAKLCGVRDVKFPLVKAAFKGKDGNLYVGMMLIDTGSVDCILNKSVLQLVDDSIVKEGKVKNIYSMNSAKNICQEVEFEFKMGNEVFSDTFYVNDSMDFNHMFESFIGIIGFRFLIKHKLTLDYSTETLHTSNDINEQTFDYEFFFPMEFGIEQYNIPVVGLISNDKEFVMVADSGANNTILTEHVLKEAGISVETNDEKGSVTGFNGNEVTTEIGKVNLSLLSLGGTADKPKICNFKDSIQVVNQHKYLMDNLKTSKGEPLLPISGLLSSSFMQKHKWILDFKHGVIYSLKIA